MACAYTYVQLADRTSIQAIRVLTFDAARITDPRCGHQRRQMIMLITLRGGRQHRSPASLDLANEGIRPWVGRRSTLKAELLKLLKRKAKSSALHWLQKSIRSGAEYLVVKLIRTKMLSARAWGAGQPAGTRMS